MFAVRDGYLINFIYVS